MVTVWTVGHSDRSAADLISLLRAHGIELVADVRRYPGSRRNPQFGSEALRSALSEAGMAYVALPALGGRRRARPGSPNQGLKSAQFRGFADYMATPEFAAALEALLATAAARRTAIMCAEALPWRCHRSLIADALAARGVEVLHILGAGPPRPHALSPAARVSGGAVTYPALL
jgi:uncharacterized protein (DUF488 family)